MNDEEYQTNRDTSQLNTFWDQWHKEYLLSLRETLPLRHKGVRSAIDSVPQEGEVVFIEKQDTPRGTWIIGRLEETIVRGDGNIRSAKVRLPSHKIISRPINFYIQWNFLWKTTIPYKIKHWQSDIVVE